MTNLSNKNLKRLTKKNSDEIKRLLSNFERYLNEIDKKAENIKQKIISGHGANNQDGSFTVL
ncbi:hypothetical protein A2567_00265 [Candidatus Azambacteria bacterium RIFOXYD1_FULL_42_11]|uniref:Uncharacterized protein n=1 Tax=Candidatus Azambacteria bacterium RIFOXYD1_FULL_42_11 TaxID=1797310 RepID=A0A1F5CJN2_9BACT|nr:MAG: hypothetical protein A2567_00265 [Candidatus Azambacteria bacterium RIFOXYD1_FULL_42_11]